MSQQETIVEIARIPAEGLSKHAAAAKMSIDFPDSTLRGIQPEPVDGYWVGILQKNALSKFDDDNTDSAPVGAGSSGFDHDIATMGDDMDNFDDGMGAHEDEAQDEDLIQKMIGDKLDEILERLDALEGKSDEDEDMDFDRDMTEGRFEGRDFGGTDTGPLDESRLDGDREDMGMRSSKSSAIKVNRERAEGMTIRQARAELIKEASSHPKLKNYQVIDIDVSSDGSQFEATLAPKQRRRRNR